MQMRPFLVWRARMAAESGTATFEARRGLVVLVDHQIEAELVGNDVFVEIAVVEIGADLRIEDAVRQA